jgi:copper(I)-binding protein
MRPLLFLLLQGLVAASALARPPVEVTDAVVRMPKAGFSSTVVVMNVRASGDMKIVGASSDFATIDLRATRREGVEVSMRPVDTIALPADASVQLRTGVGSSVLMASGIRVPLHDGDRLPITLRVQRAEGGKIVPVRVLAKVVAPPSYNPVPEIHAH